MLRSFLTHHNIESRKARTTNGPRRDVNAAPITFRQRRIYQTATEAEGGNRRRGMIVAPKGPCQW